MAKKKKKRFDSRGKGNSFERKIAKDILTAAGSKFSKEDCYRTPSSGGLVVSGWRFDLVISRRLSKIFPYGVECKHYRSVDFQHFFTGQGKIRSWIDQALAANEEMLRAHRLLLTPIVIFRWNLSNTFAIVPAEILPTIKFALHFPYRGQNWKCVLFSTFLKKVFPK